MGRGACSAPQPLVHRQVRKIRALPDEDRLPVSGPRAARQDVVARAGTQAGGPLMNLVRIDLT